MSKDTRQTYICRGAYPCWTKAEDERLISIVEQRAPVKGKAGWEKIAEEFPGRSYVATRQRHLLLRNKAAGIQRVRVRTAVPSRSHIRAPVKPDSRPAPLPPVEYKTLTAAFFRDPPPGRSALDKINAGIVDDYLPSDYRTRWEDRIANPPKITLATEPMR